MAETVTTDIHAAPGQQWTVETAMAHCLSVIANNDRRYEERFSTSQKALEAAFAAQEKAINAALTSAERAVLKAEVATEKRFESVNEFRGTLDNQQRTLIPRSEVDVLFRGVDSKLIAIEKQLDAQTAERQGLKGGYGWAVGIVGLVLTIATLLGMFLKSAPQNIVVPSATVAPTTR